MRILEILVSLEILVPRRPGTYEEPAGTRLAALFSGHSATSRSQ
jgi:hypothetical protein